ncbi:hypothetical protein BASA81_007737 [Batrachochytrium salamandrivorans]|nr:hypothetical protein BASA81_007737 [Batrachochytrium salamandrivorans]
MAQALLGDVFLLERTKLKYWTSCFVEAVLQNKPSSCLPYILSRDGFPTRIFFVGFMAMFVLLVFIRRIVAKPVSKLCLGMYRPPFSPQLVSRQDKFVSSFVEFTLYTSFGVMGTMLLLGQQWVWHPETWSRGWWETTPAVNVSAHVLVFSLLYAARYLAMLVSLVVLEPRKKDFMEMCLHHIVTVFLVCTSVTFGYIRIGLVIMVIFDYADPFLHLAKMFNYMKQSFPRVKLLALLTDLFLGLFALVFSITRIGLFSYVVYSVSVESYRVVGQNQELMLGMSKVEVGHHISVLLVWILYGLQWFWFGLLAKVVYKTVVLGAEAGDNRSSDEEQEEKKKQ